ncbi:MAG: hypothetical protein KF901_10625 [Myxococcales bacterium]|nr:hypothetical protein [Myxococcales bacterium]
MRVWAIGVATLPIWLSVLACLPQPDPDGDPVGDFRITGVLAANECGPTAIPAQDLIELRVQLRADGALAVWRAPGAAIVHGTHDRGTFRFNLQSTVAVYEGDPDLGIGPCSLDQLETILVEVATEAGPDAGVVDDGGMNDASDGGASDGGPSDAGTSDAGASDVATLVGTTSVRFRPSAGSSCQALLAIYGGPFDTLPCEVRYRVQGTRMSTPLFE